MVDLKSIFQGTPGISTPSPASRRHEVTTSRGHEVKRSGSPDRVAKAPPVAPRLPPQVDARRFGPASSIPESGSPEDALPLPEEIMAVVMDTAVHGANILLGVEEPSRAGSAEPTAEELVSRQTNPDQIADLGKLLLDLEKISKS